MTTWLSIITDEPKLLTSGQKKYLERLATASKSVSKNKLDGRRKSHLPKSIKILALSKKIINSLIASKIENMCCLCKMSKGEVKNLSGIGKTNCLKIEKSLEKYGLKLNTELSDFN